MPLSFFKRWWWRFGICLILALLLWLTYTAVSIDLYGRRATGLEAHGDVAVVLGAAVWNDRPSPVFQTRIDWAIELYRKKCVPKLLFTGGKGEGKLFSEAEIGRRHALSKGVSAEDIWMEDKSHTTFQNLYHALPVAREHGAQKWIMVSDSWHLHRAMRMARTLDIQVEPSATPYTRYAMGQKKWSMILREAWLETQYRVTALFLNPQKHPACF